MNVACVVFVPLGRSNAMFFKSDLCDLQLKKK